jgi:predicted amidohydrolase YtcJ
MAKSLNYEDLSVPMILERLREFLLEEEDISTQDQWLLVLSWNRNVGDDPTRKFLDTLPTRRPIILFSDDCHFAALNTRAMEKLQLTKNTIAPKDGWIRQDKDSELNGIIEDGLAMRVFDTVMRLMGRADLYEGLKKALNSLSAQGVTTCLDARTAQVVLELMSLIRDQGELPLRYLGAIEIRSGAYVAQKDVDMALDAAMDLKDKFDTGSWDLDLPLTLEHIKFFVDGMPSTLTAYLKEPYNENLGTIHEPRWEKGSWRGAAYFEKEALTKLVVKGASCGLWPHFHTIADGAVEMTLESLSAMRKEIKGTEIRPALAHLDLVSPEQFQIIKDLGAFAVLSFQWSGISQKKIDNFRSIYGEKRFNYLENHAKFLDSGVKVAYGSDWPVEPLDEFGNFQVGMTRRALGSDCSPRLENDRDLTLTEVLRAATITAAESLGKEKFIGSLESGKFADFVVLEGKLFERPKTDIHKTEVLETIVGGNTVYKKGDLEKGPQ